MYLRPALGREARDAAPCLQEALRHRRSEVRIQAALALGAVGATAAVPQLAATLYGTLPEPAFRLITPVGPQDLDYGAVRWTGFVAPLIGSHFRRESDTRWAAARALGQIGDRRGVRALLDALDVDDAEDPLLHCEAVASLGRLRDGSALKPLSALLVGDGDDRRRSEDAMTRSAAAQALGEIGDPTAVACLLEAATADPDDAVRQAAFDGLVAIGESGTEPLREALGSDDAEVRRVAKEALEALRRQLNGS